MQARSELTEICTLLRTGIAAIGVTWATGVKPDKYSIYSIEKLSTTCSVYGHSK